MSLIKRICPKLILIITKFNYSIFFAYRFHPVQRTKFLGHRDLSITQFALADDDNVSQQATKGGGGGLTLASQWKSQFDDSEETDNELKADNLQSPEHKQRLTVSLYLQSMTKFCSFIFMFSLLLIQ